MGCEPGGFGWSATVEVCSARVTRVVTNQEKSKKFSTRQPVPGTGGVDEICQHFDSGYAKVPGTNGTVLHQHRNEPVTAEVPVGNNDIPSLETRQEMAKHSNLASVFPLIRADRSIQ